MFHPIEIPDRKGLREFGLVTGALFIILFGLFFPWLLSAKYPLWPWIIASILAILAVVLPNSLSPIYRGWMLIGMVLGWINTHIILAFLFFFIVTPIGWLMRLLGQNPLRPSYERPESYRKICHPRSIKHMEHPF